MKKTILVLSAVMVLGMLLEGLFTALADPYINQGEAPGYNLVDAYAYKIPNIVIDPCAGYTFF